MKALITGGTGLLGRELLANLSEDSSASCFECGFVDSRPMRFRRAAATSGCSSVGPRWTTGLRTRARLRPTRRKTLTPGADSGYSRWASRSEGPPLLLRRS